MVRGGGGAVLAALPGDDAGNARRFRGLGGDGGAGAPRCGGTTEAGQQVCAFAMQMLLLCFVVSTCVCYVFFCAFWAMPLLLCEGEEKTSSDVHTAVSVSAEQDAFRARVGMYV